MSVRKQGEVLIDQNRNLLPPNWRQCSSSAYTSGNCMAQSDKVASYFQQSPAYENTQPKFKVPAVNGFPTNAGDTGEQMLTKLKEHTTENADRESVSPKKIVPCDTEENGDDLIYENVPEDQQESVSSETIQKRVCLVKLYAWIKEEMSKTSAKSIAGHLYQSEHRLLSRCDHESIMHCTWRREAVEQLLKKVLMGPADIHELFIKALKEQEEKHIAEKLDKETATDEEIQVFTALEWSSLGRCLRPESHQPRLKFTDSDLQTLLYYLNNKNTIDNINDHFLSRFIFSIREHTNINHCCMDSEKRVKELINTLKVCAEQIFKDFCEILSAIEMSHVIAKLEKRSQGSVTCKQRQKRKSTPTQGNDSEPSMSSSSAKRQCLNSTVECRLVTSMQRSSSTLRLHAINQLGFDVENVNKGSIVIQLCPKEPDSWRKLEENCRTGKIKDFIPVVYNNESVQDLLEEGEYRLKFTIYTLPTRPDKQEEKKVMFHLETEQEKQSKEKQQEEKKMVNGQHESLLEECSDLLCEELEINKDLITLLKSEKLVEDNIKEEIDKQGSRSKKIRYLIKKIGSHGIKGYNVLKEYIKEENEDLYKAMVTKEEVKVIDNKMDTAAKVTKNRPTSHREVYKKQVFFTGTVVLMVKKNVIKKQKGSKSCTEMEITCPEILDPVCHFTEKGKENETKSGEVTLVLEEAWGLVGANQPAKREILVGKRKQAKDSASSSKRVHSVLEETDSEEERGECEVETQDTDLKDKSSSPSKSDKKRSSTVEENESSQKKDKDAKKT